MLPLVLDVSSRRVVVVGQGDAARRRYEYAREASAEAISLYLLEHDGWACHAEAALYGRLPDRADLAGAALVLIAGLGAADTAEVVAEARAAGALVNVEDRPGDCDFHVPATVRRGDLLLTVSTGGAAPGLAATVRSYLQNLFGPEWAEHAGRVGEARKRWRSAGLKPSEVARRTASIVEENAWLSRKTGS